MRELDIKRLNALTEDLEKRVNILEIKKVNREEIVTIEENVNDLLFKPTNNQKIFRFISKTSTYAVANITVNSGVTFSAQCDVMANGNLVKSKTVSFPFSLEVPFKTNMGENEIKIALSSERMPSSFKLDIAFSVTGNVMQKQNQNRIGVLFGDCCYYRFDDAIKSINVNTMETVACYTGKEAVAVGFLKGNYVCFLIKENGTVRIERHSMNSNDSYKTIPIDIALSNCSIEVNNGVTYLYMLKGENAYMYGYMSENKTFLHKLPFKASYINCFLGSTGRYICYTDKRGNFSVVKHYSYTDYREEKSVSLGKLENANLSEEDGKLMVLYKQGLVIFKRPVFENADPVIVGVGDEAIITEQGVTVIRKKDKLIKL